MIKRLADGLIFWLILFPVGVVLFRLIPEDPILGPEEEPPYA